MKQEFNVKFPLREVFVSLIERLFMGYKVSGTASNNGGGMEILLKFPDKTVPAEIKITGPNSCVGCGYCCKQSSCPYGEWDAYKGQCASLSEPNEKGQHLCLLYDKIAKDKGSWSSPGFGVGCCSPLGNTRREELLRQINPLMWILWTFNPGVVPDNVFLTYTADVADEALKRSEAAGEPVTVNQKQAVVVFREYLAGQRPYEDVTAARNAGWKNDEIEHNTSVRILFVGTLIMDSLGLVLKSIVGMGDLFGDDRWLADHLYEVIEEHRKK